MSTQQEIIEQNVRILLGDLQLQVVITKARITELEQLLKEAVLKSKENEIQNKENKENDTDNLIQTLDKFQSIRKASAANPKPE